MNRRTFLMSSLAAIGTGLFLSKKGEASEGRKLISVSRGWDYYDTGKVKMVWLSKEYLVEKPYNMELETELLYINCEQVKVKPNLMAFMDMEDG